VIASLGGRGFLSFQIFVTTGFAGSNMAGRGRVCWPLAGLIRFLWAFCGRRVALRWAYSIPRLGGRDWVKVEVSDRAGSDPILSLFHYLCCSREGEPRHLLSSRIKLYS
jgi:hypothetical protein